MAHDNARVLLHCRIKSWSSTLLILVASIASFCPIESTFAFVPERTVTLISLGEHNCSCQGALKSGHARRYFQHQHTQIPPPFPLRLSTLQDIDLTPLYLSSIAGASTCIGAAIVFLFPVDPDSGTRTISPQILGFSLALAGSVMLTVCAVSILPECLESVHTVEDLAERTIWFAGGAAMYYLLSMNALPEPEDIIREQWGVLNASEGDGMTAFTLTKEQ